MLEKRIQAVKLLQGNSYNNYTYKNHLFRAMVSGLISTQASSWTYGVSFKLLMLAPHQIYQDQKS